jgi:hypothetical protein
MPRLYASPSVRVAAFAALAVLAALLPACVNPNAIGEQNSGSIIGRVYDAKTNQPIVHAIVSVNSLLAGSTDGSGAFSIPNVPIGIQQVTVRAVGYATYTSGDIAVTTGKTSDAGLIPLQPLNGP